MSTKQLPSTPKASAKKAPAKQSAQRRRRSAPKARRASAKKTPAAQSPSATERPVDRVFEVLPARVQEIGYVTRTWDILHKRSRRAAKMRADTRRELRAVASDLEADVRGSVRRVQDGLQERREAAMRRARDTRLGHEVGGIRDRAVDRFDAWLDRAGLVRKARVGRLAA